MARYMLDTNIIIYARNQRPEQVYDMLRHHQPSDICLSSITLAELAYGVANSSRPQENLRALQRFLSAIQIMAFDDAAALEYGKIRADLRNKGTPIGANDLLIAAHARALDVTLVTNNEKEFQRVENLKIENWTKQSAL